MKQIELIICVLIAFTTCTPSTKEKESNYLSFPDNEALYSYFQYNINASPIIQGHRGTIENGLPENSIAAFEYVLEQMPATFEIDPRLTKDSIIVVFHDATLERNSTGEGRVIDHTWNELQQLHLKNAKGEATEYKILTLAEVLEWARGKTVLVLDKKDVPLQMIADIIRKYDANNYVINMVRSPEDARFYFEDNRQRMFSISMRSPDDIDAYRRIGIPFNQMFACIGTTIREENKVLYSILHLHGVRCLIATATTYDKLDSEEQKAQAYRNIIEDGASIIESNFPVEVYKAVTKK